MSRVFILDYDVLSSIGIGREETWKNIQANYSGAKKLSRFSTENLPCDFGAEITTPLSPQLSSFSESIQRACHFDRKLEMILSCYAIMKDRLKNYFSDHDPMRAGLIFGLGLDITPIENLHALMQKNPSMQEVITLYRDLNNTTDRMNIIANPLDIACVILARELKIAGFQKSTLTACSASSQSVAFGIEAIQRNKMDLILVGGTDSLLNTLGIVAFSKLGIISSSDEAPEQICKPLDKNRSSVLLGEGAGLMVLASESFVKARGLKPQLELTGFGNSLDGYKITAPDPEARGMRKAIEQALMTSGWEPSEVDYINLHGTGTIANDPLELKAIQDVFGKASENLTVSSTKDRHGHMIAAAGIMELCLLSICMEHDLVPCTRNLKRPILDGGLDLLREHNAKKEIRKALSNSFAFGGVNTVLAIQKN